MRVRHPEQISNATGAAGVVIGPWAKALAADWKHRLGVSFARITEMLSVAYGLPFMCRGLCQADTRPALKRAQAVYAELYRNPLALTSPRRKPGSRSRPNSLDSGLRQNDMP